jgi:hypothetical protein
VCYKVLEDFPFQNRHLKYIHLPIDTRLDQVSKIVYDSSNLKPQLTHADDWCSCTMTEIYVYSCFNSHLVEDHKTYLNKLYLYYMPSVNTGVFSNNIIDRLCVSLVASMVFGNKTNVWLQILLGISFFFALFWMNIRQYFNLSVKTAKNFTDMVEFITFWDQNCYTNAMYIINYRHTLSTRFLR